jgi:hypothetical protein
MSSPPILLQALSDPSWIEAERRMWPDAPSRRVVKLEGVMDVTFFQVHCQEFNHKLTFNYGGGKSEVIDSVKRNEFSLGIVDMDYDFESNEVSSSSRLTDTSSQCCLFSAVLEGAEADLVDVTRDVILLLATDGSATRLLGSMAGRASEFTDRVHELTAKRIFNGYRRSCDYSGDFESFNIEYEEQLRLAGANDHALCTALEEFFDEMGVDFAEGRVQKKIESIMTNKLGTTTQRKKVATMLLNKLSPESPFNAPD